MVAQPIRRLLALTLFTSVLLVPAARAQLPELEPFILGPNAEEGEQPPGSPPPTLRFGESVAIYGNTALVSLPAFSGEPRVAVFTRNAAGEWQRSDSLEGELGLELAVYGNHALINEHDHISAFRRIGGAWRRVQTIPVQGAAQLVLHQRTAAYLTLTFAQPIALNFLHLDAKGIWRRGQTLGTTDAVTAGPHRNEALALGRDTLVLGIPADDEFRGAAYIFRRVGPRWHEDRKLVAADGEPGDQFGAGVAVHGSRLAIGAPGADRLEFEIFFAGAVYVFDRSGRSWVERQRIKPAATDTEQAYSGFGQQVALTGTMLAVLAPALHPFNPAHLFVYEPGGRQRLYTAKGVLVFSLEGISDIAASRRTVVIGVPFDSPFMTGFVAGYTNVPGR